MNPVTESIDYVVEKSRYVKINEDKIREFTNNFNLSNLKHWIDEAPFDFSKLSDKEKTNFFFIFNAISFSYWGDPKWSVEYKGKKYERGTWNMIASLKRALDEGKSILDSSYLSDIKQKDLEEILRGNVQIPLLKERLEILRELGIVVNQKYKGNFDNVINSAEEDAIKLLNIIVNNFPSFNDYSVYDNKKVYFHKRAQILVSDVDYIRNENLKNIEQLTGCADYKIPGVLIKKKILECNEKLQKKIDNKIEVPKGSEEEIEIRANTIFAIELIKKELKPRIPNITSMQINDRLWLDAGEITSYHLTRTTAY